MVDYTDITPLLFKTDDNGLLLKDDKGKYIPTGNKLIVEKTDMELNGDKFKDYAFKISDKDGKVLFEYKPDLSNITQLGTAELPVIDNKIDYSAITKNNESNISTRIDLEGFETFSLTKIVKSLEDTKSMHESKTPDYGRVEFKIDNKLFVSAEDVVLDKNKYEKRETNYCVCANNNIRKLGEIILTAQSNGIEQELLKAGTESFIEIDKFAKKFELSLSGADVKLLLKEAKGILGDGIITESERQNFGARSAKLGLTDSGVTDASGNRKIGWMVE